MQNKLSEINDIISEHISKGTCPVSISILTSKVKDLKESMDNENTFNEKYDNLISILIPKSSNPIIRGLYKDILLISPKLSNVYRPAYMEYTPKILSSTYIVNDYLYNKSRGKYEDFVYSGILDADTSKFIIKNTMIDIVQEKSIDLSMDLSIDIANRILLIKDKTTSSVLLSEIQDLVLEQVDVIKSIDKDFKAPEIYGALLCNKSLIEDDRNLIELSELILKGGKI